MAFRSKSIFGIALVAAVFAAANGSGEKPKASPPPPVVEVSPVSREEALMANRLAAMPKTVPYILPSKHSQQLWMRGMPIKRRSTCLIGFLLQRAGTTAMRPWNSYLAISQCTSMRRWAGS